MNTCDSAHPSSRHALHQIIGESAPMQRLKHTVAALQECEARLGDSPPPAALIVGETGTGKELVARALHFDGARRAAPFVELNCGALPPQLIEAELFGYERGAFTDARQRKVGLVESAQSGSVFLDEIGEAELATQVKLLEERRMRRLGGLSELPVNARIISATNRPLEQMVREGRFRADLYFRLRIVEIPVPPLRERGDDVLLLARHYLQRHGQRYQRPGLRLSAQAERALMAYAWPGNVRELRNAMEQAVLVARGDKVDAIDLQFAGESLVPSATGYSDAMAPPGHPALGDDFNLERAEKRLISHALQRTQHNVSAAARLLGISRDTLRYRLERLALRAAHPPHVPLAPLAVQVAGTAAHASYY
jgi:two-component system response regulator AtoC